MTRSTHQRLNSVRFSSIVLKLLPCHARYSRACERKIKMCGVAAGAARGSARSSAGTGPDCRAVHWPLLPLLHWVEHITPQESLAMVLGRTARVPARRGALTEHRAGRRQIGNAFARTVCVRYASVKAPARLSKFPRARAGYSLHAIERFVGAWTIACSGAGRLARLNSVFPFSPPPLRDKLLAPAIVYLRGHNACCSCCRGARPLSQLLLPCAYGRYHSCSISTRCFPCALLLLLPKRSLHLLPPLDHAPRLAPVVELHAHLHHPKL